MLSFGDSNPVTENGSNKKELKTWITLYFSNIIVPWLVFSSNEQCHAVIMGHLFSHSRATTKKESETDIFIYPIIIHPDI